MAEGQFTDILAGGDGPAVDDTKIQVRHRSTLIFGHNSRQTIQLTLRSSIVSGFIGNYLRHCNLPYAKELVTVPW